MSREWIDPATGTQILEDAAATKEYIHPVIGGQLQDAVAAAAAATGQLLQIPHHQRGGFNPMHGGFSA